MPDPTPPSQAGGGDGAGSGDEHAGGLARWQKVAGIIGLAVVVALVILLLVGDHGPGRHAPGGEQGQPADVEGSARHGPSEWHRG